MWLLNKFGMPNGAKWVICAQRAKMRECSPLKALESAKSTSSSSSASSSTAAVLSRVSGAGWIEGSIGACGCSMARPSTFKTEIILDAPVAFVVRECADIGRCCGSVRECHGRNRASLVIRRVVVSI